MSALQEIYIKKEILTKIIEVLDKKGEKGISITLSVSDEANQYGQNISAYVSQSKEDREDGNAKFYVGNGKVFWGVGKIDTAPKAETQHAQTGNNDNLPF